MKRVSGVAVLLAAVVAGCGNAGPGPGPGTGPFDSGPIMRTCASPLTDCNGSCVNIETDAANCGGCGVVCGGGAVCSGGACVTRQPTCPNPQILCGGACVNAQTDNANCGACGIACSGRSSCQGGACVEPVPDPCGPSAPGGVCPSGQTCIGGACCAQAQACGAACCSAGSTCVRDGAGNLSCARRCQTSSECASSSGCCAMLYNDAGRDVGYGACLAPTPGVTYCRCSTQSECGSSGGCTPITDANRVPIGPYACTALGCAPYQRCTGVLGSCPNGYCNLCDSAGRCFCAQVCASDAQCGGARCVTYGQSIGSCPANQRACAP